MAKALVGDKVSVMKVHADTDTKFIAVTGVLAALDKGRKTEDKRAHAEEGDCPSELVVDAKGWCLVTTDDGKQVSAPTKEVTLFSQKIVLEHNETMAQVAVVQSARAASGRVLEEARAGRHHADGRQPAGAQHPAGYAHRLICFRSYPKTCINGGRGEYTSAHFCFWIIQCLPK
jgi:hypothetical protein